MDELDNDAISALAGLYPTHDRIELLYQAAGYANAPPSFPDAVHIFRKIWRDAERGASVQPLQLVRVALNEAPRNQSLRRWLDAHEGPAAGSGRPPQPPRQASAPTSPPADSEGEVAGQPRLPDPGPSTPTTLSPVPPSPPVPGAAKANAQPREAAQDPTLPQVIKTLRFAYTGVWGAKVFWLALLTLTPILLGLKGLFSLNISIATAIYSAYHSIAFINWLSAQQIEHEARSHPKDEREFVWLRHPKECCAIYQRHRRYVRPLSIAVMVLLTATFVAKANWYWGEDHAKLKLPTWVYRILGTPQPHPLKDRLRDALLKQARAETPADFDLDHQQTSAFIDRCYVFGTPIAENANGPFYRALLTQQAFDAPNDCREHSVQRIMDLAREGPILILGDPSVRKLPPLRALRAALVTRRNPAVLIVIRECLGHYADPTFIEDCVAASINRALVSTGRAPIDAALALSLFAEDKDLWLLVDSIDDPGDPNTVESIARQLLTVSQRFDRRLVVSGRPELLESFLYERIHVDEVRRFAESLRPILLTGLSRAGFKQLAANHPNVRARFELLEAMSNCSPDSENSRLARGIARMTAVLTSPPSQMPSISEACTAGTRERVLSWALSARFDNVCYGAVCDQANVSREELRRAWAKAIQILSETPDTRQDFSVAEIAAMAWSSPPSEGVAARQLLSVLLSTGVFSVTSNGRVAVNRLWIPHAEQRPPIPKPAPIDTRERPAMPKPGSDQQVACDSAARLVASDAGFDANAYIAAQRNDARRLAKCTPTTRTPELMARIAAIRAILDKDP